MEVVVVVLLPLVGYHWALWTPPQGVWHAHLRAMRMLHIMVTMHVMRVMLIVHVMRVMLVVLVVVACILAPLVEAAVLV